MCALCTDQRKLPHHHIWSIETHLIQPSIWSIQAFNFQSDVCAKVSSLSAPIQLFGSHGWSLVKSGYYLRQQYIITLLDTLYIDLLFQAQYLLLAMWLESARLLAFDFWSTIFALGNVSFMGLSALCLWREHWFWNALRNTFIIASLEYNTFKYKKVNLG